MNHTRKHALAVLALLLSPLGLPAQSVPSVASGNATASGDQRAWRQELDAWRSQREHELSAPDGWLTLVGLEWLKPGINSFGDQVNPGQHLTRAEALRLFTRTNSWFMRMEDKIGSIEPGKLADLVVLDRDYFAVPDAEIKKIRSVLTIVNGQIVHNAGMV